MHPLLFDNKVGSISKTWPFGILSASILMYMSAAKSVVRLLFLDLIFARMFLIARPHDECERSFQLRLGFRMAAVDNIDLDDLRDSCILLTEELLLLKNT